MKVDPRTAVGPDYNGRVRGLEARLAQIEAVMPTGVWGTDQTIKGSHDRLDTLLGAGGDGPLVATGVYADLPAASAAGRLYLCSDAPIVLRDTGAAWVAWACGFPVTLPVAADYAWVNQGGATATTTNGGIYLLAPYASPAVDNYRILKKAAPARPYSIVLCMLPNIHDYRNSCGFVWRQSSDGKLVGAMITTDTTATLPAVAVAKYSAPGTWVATYATYRIAHQGLVFLKLDEDNTNRTVSWSSNGQTWHQVHQVGRTDYLTADEIGMACNANHATKSAGCWFLGWTQS